MGLIPIAKILVKNATEAVEEMKGAVLKPTTENEDRQRYTSNTYENNYMFSINL